MNTEFDGLKLRISAIGDHRPVRADQLQLIPRGTFAGTVYELGFVRDGKLVSANTGEQGGGQN